MPWGTPDQVLRKLEQVRAAIDMNGLLCHVSYAGMPNNEAEQNLRLFAAEVLPELKGWHTELLGGVREPVGSGTRPTEGLVAAMRACGRPAGWPTPWH